MREDYTHFTVILDRSGSMQSIREDTIGGFNAFLSSQKKEPGRATFTLVQFDSQDPYEVIHHFTPAADVPELTRETYVPRGGTPLLDALGRGINDVEKCVAELAEEERPSKVVIAIVTDGAENASREFGKEQIEQMINARRQENDWQFVFLSADLAAIAEAHAIGVPRSSSLRYAKSARGVAHAWNEMSIRSSDYRAAHRAEIGFGAGRRAKSKNPDDSEKKDA